ncbi:anti-sigma regulatory factor (Ser/Thr protein kinase) [Nocardiopsis aegyptia]|uniref:Anti-sigma regulatory factor (Ser/Thr protein kinase) n=1 Tax=Nocardiopsis aegyptia TaxID=220378 RepID=A0A7Z0J8T7_9ACTN|nr:anti-sigma regulatory factor (Ser/Thr protein kinase) [Nocardiopsis aegyptia]
MRALDLPRRIRYADPDTSGLVCGADPQHVRIARRWAMQATRTTPCLAHPLVVSLAELHTNALKHSASGLLSGRVRIEIERRERLFLLRVTDEGARPGGGITVPEVRAGAGVEKREPALAEGGYGLALVDAMALYWDFTGGEGGPVTVRAAFDRSGRPRPRP